MKTTRNSKAHKCRTCSEKTSGVGHLCDPQPAGNRVKFYICMGCGLITTEQYLLCKPKILRLK
jgi:hypothetical protein